MQAQAYLEKAEAVAGGVMLKGHVSFQALYTQGDLTRIRAMETTCDFEHSIEAQEATPDMRVNASVAVQETEGTAVSGRMTLRALSTAVSAAQAVMIKNSSSNCSQGICSSMLQ